MEKIIDMNKRNPKVVVIGGGTGLSVMLEA